MNTEARKPPPSGGGAVTPSHPRSHRHNRAAPGRSAPPTRRSVRRANRSRRAKSALMLTLSKKCMSPLSSIRRIIIRLVKLNVGRRKVG